MSFTGKRLVGLSLILAILIMCALPALIMTMCSGATSDVIRLYRTASDTVDELPFAKYIEGCVASEIDFEVDYPEQALIAISLSIESRMLALCGHCEHASAYSVDFCDCRPHGSGYLPVDEAVKLYGTSRCDEVYSAIHNALAVCLGLGVCYDGSLALTLTHESSYLMTESSVSVTGEDIPYLRSVRTYEEIEPRSVRMSRDTAYAYLRAGFGITDDFDELEITSRTAADRVSSINVGDTVIDGIELASLLSLGSTDFTIERDGEDYIFHVRGEGNGVGLSCMGACRLAADNVGFEEIIAAYFPGTVISTVNTAELING